MRRRRSPFRKRRCQTISGTPDVSFNRLDLRHLRADAPADIAGEGRNELPGHRITDELILRRIHDASLRSSRMRPGQI